MINWLRNLGHWELLGLICIILLIINFEILRRKLEKRELQKQNSEEKS